MLNSERHLSISRYNIPTGGGVVGLIALIGMCVMLLSDGFARTFLFFALPTACLIAVGLYIFRRWKED